MVAAVPLLTQFVSAFNLAPTAVPVEAIRAVFIAAICAHDLRDLLPGSRPLIYLIGPPGSGKTTMARLVGKIISGESWDITGLPSQERDFWPVIANMHPTVLDNVESPSPWVLDAIARASSGAVQRVRKLYSNSEVVMHRACSFFWLTTYSGGVLRGDLLDRALIFRLGLPTQRIAEFDLLNEVAQQRQNLLREMHGVRNGVLHNVQQHGRPSPRDASDRLADFISVGRAIASVTGGEQQVALFNAGIEAMRIERLLVAMNDPLVAVLIDWAASDENRNPDGTPGVWVNARYLRGRFSDALGGERDFDSTARNVAALGKFLMELRVKASGILRIDTKTLHGTQMYRIALAAPLPTRGS